MTKDEPSEEKVSEEQKDQGIELSKETLEDLDAPATDADAVKGGQPSKYGCTDTCQCI